jgi:hypothetical protein
VGWTLVKLFRAEIYGKPGKKERNKQRKKERKKKDNQVIFQTHITESQTALILSK